MASSRILNPETITANANHVGVTRLGGFAVRESAVDPGAAATVRFRHETATGQLFFPLELAAGESAGITFQGHISAPGGVYVEVLAGGTVEGVLYDME